MGLNYVYKPVDSDKGLKTGHVKRRIPPVTANFLATYPVDGRKFYCYG